MSQHPFMIHRDNAEMLADLLAWNLRHDVIHANGADPWCEELLHELCDTFKFGGATDEEREECIDRWAKDIQDKLIQAKPGDDHGV
jgi:hypothetical protein